MRILDQKPATVTDPSGNRITTARIVGDRVDMPDGGSLILVRVYTKERREVIEVARFVATSHTGSRKVGRFTLPDGTIWHHNPGAGCNCRDALLLYRVPRATADDILAISPTQEQPA